MEGLVVLIWLLFFALLVFLPIAGQWKTFTKAGQPGWAAIIPVYNYYVWCKVAQRPGWWTLLFLIPIANVVVAIVVSFDTAAAFDKNGLYGLGLWLLPMIFFPVIGFGSATYLGRPGAPLSLPA